MTFIAVTPAHAQQDGAHEQTGGFERVTAQPIDQRVEDVNPLAASLRHVDAGLEQPLRFANVYRLSDGRHMRVDGALHAVFPQSVYTGETQQGAARIPPGTVFYIGAPPSEAFTNQSAFGESEQSMPHRSGGMLRDAMRLKSDYNPRWNTFVGARGQGADEQSSAGAARSAPSATERNTNNRAPNRFHIGDSVHPAARSGTLLTTQSPRNASHHERSPRIWSDDDYRTARMRELLRKAVSAESASNMSHTSEGGSDSRGRQ